MDATSAPELFTRQAEISLVTAPWHAAANFRRRPFDRGFTLVELLVVVSIMTILASMLLVIIGKTKDKAKRTVCLNNLKQINLYVRLYSDDFNDTAPKVSWTTNSADMYLDGQTGFKRLLELRGLSNLFACPADTFYHSFDGSPNAGRVNQPLRDQPIADFTSYGLNGGQMTIFGTNTPGIGGQKLASVMKPVRTVLVAEMPAFFPWSWHQPHRDTAPFNDAKNMMSFVDGHVSYVPIYWNSQKPFLFTLQYDPPQGYDYQWSEK
jgi:prepilin-type N-terminal cleavage/methylation domain-containing protein/prepilin-type processing-associated H-X9-DG protein